VQHPSLDPGGVFLAFDGELVVGLGVGSVPIPKSDSSARVGAIELLAVRASHRRQGIGRALIQRVLCWLASQDVTTVSVSAEHPVLLATLKRYGFGPLPTPIPPGNQLLGGQ
jgi:GNAT superfamily N-acetyltransferase